MKLFHLRKAKQKTQTAFMFNTRSNAATSRQHLKGSVKPNLIKISHFRIYSEI